MHCSLWRPANCCHSPVFTGMPILDIKEWKSTAKLKFWLTNRVMWWENSREKLSLILTVITRRSVTIKRGGEWGNATGSVTYLCAEIVLGKHYTAHLGSNDEMSSCHGDQVAQPRRTRRTRKCNSFPLGCHSRNTKDGKNNINNTAITIQHCSVSTELSVQIQKIKESGKDVFKDIANEPETLNGPHFTPEELLFTFVMRQKVGPHLHSSLDWNLKAACFSIILSG